MKRVSPPNFIYTYICIHTHTSPSSPSLSLFSPYHIAGPLSPGSTTIPPASSSSSPPPSRLTQVLHPFPSIGSIPSLTGVIRPRWDSALFFPRLRELFENPTGFTPPPLHTMPSFQYETSLAVSIFFFLYPIVHSSRLRTNKEKEVLFLV